MNIGGERQIESYQITDKSQETDDDKTYIIILFDVHPPVGKHTTDYDTDNGEPGKLYTDKFFILHHFLIENFFQYMLGCQKCFHYCD